MLLDKYDGSLRLFSRMLSFEPVFEVLVIKSRANPQFITSLAEQGKHPKISPRPHGTDLIVIMAPSATETITKQDSPAVLKLHSTQSGTGDYKQLQAHGIDRDAETGKKGFEAAKVRCGRICPKNSSRP